MSTLRDLRFENSFGRLHPAFYEVVDPTPLPEPYLVAFNPDAAALLDLDPSEAANPELCRYLSGNQRIPGAEPLAQAYAGHQFGVWVPQLGDGRAFLLGEVRNAGESWDLHLKGAGRTRFSRFGDGRSVLRSAVREYLASEALHGLGVPTTRALSIVGSKLPVYREQAETAAVLLRLSPSHVRFGTFQYFAARGEAERVRELADYVLERHFAEGSLRCARDDGSGSLGCARDDSARYRWFYGEVCRRTARLIAQWTAAGFAHGVLNTDNMSVLGITLDYGPYGFLDDYDAGFICNHTDTGGRYAFDQQPAVGMWNCARFGEALMVLGGDPAAWQGELEGYWPEFAAEYRRLMLSKLGLNSRSTDSTDFTDDEELVSELLRVLQVERTDYTRFFRGLGEYCVNGQRSTVNGNCASELSAWLTRYAARLRAEGSVDAERAERMRRVNPKYVLRNWIAQEAIGEAQAGRFELIEALRRLFSDPWEEHPEMERFAESPSAESREIAVSCSS
ncbi:MAG TPA: YdiU family protein [Gemmatimonadales bacterium]|nr:YdiU family protein [Gemmatimonadales bacterium]